MGARRGSPAGHSAEEAKNQPGSGTVVRKTMRMGPSMPITRVIFVAFESGDGGEDI